MELHSCDNEVYDIIIFELDTTQYLTGSNFLLSRSLNEITCCLLSGLQIFSSRPPSPFCLWQLFFSPSPWESLTTGSGGL